MTYLLLPSFANSSLFAICRAGVGSSGSQQDIFFAEIDESMRVSDGGGIGEESIEKVFLCCEAFYFF